MTARAHCVLDLGNLRADLLRRVAPHAALRTLPAWRRLTAGRWQVKVPVSESALAAGSRIVPCLSLLTPVHHAFAFTLRAALTAGDDASAHDGRVLSRLSPVAGVASAASVRGATPVTEADGDLPVRPGGSVGIVRDAIDTFELCAPLRSVTIDCEVWPERPAEAFDPASLPGLLSIQVIPPGRPAGLPSFDGEVAIPDVPALSQMEQEVALRERICAPTSLAMVLGHYGRRVEVATLAALCHHPGSDLYGVWPMSIRAAALHGCVGYLTVFEDWQPVATLLGRGVPVIASIAYGAGELDGAAIPATDGHLVTLTGIRDGRVRVHDPAAPTAAAVPRTYDLVQFTAAWLDRRRIAYVIVPADRLGVDHRSA